jgi:multiple sugar transport system permease protein
MYNPTYGIINFVLAWVGVSGAPHWLADPRTAMLSVILVDVWQWTPFVMLLLLAALYTMPEEYAEAAAVEGAGALQTLRYVTLPFLRPFLGVVLLFRTIDAFKATETVNFFAYRQGFAFFNMGYASAISVFILTTVVVLSAMIIRSTQRLQET